MRLFAWTSPQSQNIVAVIIEKLPLAVGEGSHLGPMIDLNAHPLKGCSVGDRREDELTVPFERDEVLVEQVVNCRRKQQSVLAAQPLVV